MLPRAASFALCSLLLGVVCGAAAPSGVHARDARTRELLTPSGWDDASPTLELSLPDDELVVPAGWSSVQPCAADLGRGGDVCSELLVPTDWSAQLRERGAAPHA
jgi:hypothetical protein